MTALPLISEIQHAVANHYGILFSTMREPDHLGTRMKNVSRPRQVAMRLSALLTEQPYTVIGRHFGGRDHSTVIHACQVVEKRRGNDPELHDAMRRLTLELVR